ncbi:MAG: hypothetical protein ACP5OA_03450 [Candidatus Woesearchaeota archaeon]
MENTMSLVKDPREQMVKLLEMTRAELETLEKAKQSTMKTSGKFSWRNNKSDSDIVDIFKCESIAKLVDILGVIRLRTLCYNEAAQDLQLKSYPQLEWCGYIYDAWKEDIKIRINVLAYEDRRKKLQETVERLSKYMTEEDRMKEDILSSVNALGYTLQD